ncbi:LIM and calponin homology domains-containing protein 1-like [Bombina bombina]|uniref:LIM and calponin homology domains-containing protein 1-like n=1 Tax=Bombina bombina TaxID=8345 RepID=UPI00235B13BF|nr:LIM and calponin homology domains-containing protein 1-like [Bombina bombina]
MDSQENICGSGYSSQPSSSQCPSPNRSVSGKKLCSTCGLPLGKGAAMIIETLSLYFHIQCFKCGICKGQLGDATTGTDVRIRNGLLNCNDCYMKSRSKALDYFQIFQYLLISPFCTKLPLHIIYST